MIKKLNMKNSELAREFLTLQRLAYKIEADLIGVENFPPLNQTITDLNKETESFWGYFDERQLIGGISLEYLPSEIIISRLVVHPSRFSESIGTSLVKYVLEQNIGKRVSVSTAKKNYPAVKLYEKLGFRLLKEWKVEKDLELVIFQLPSKPVKDK